MAYEACHCGFSSQLIEKNQLLHLAAPLVQCLQKIVLVGGFLCFCVASAAVAIFPSAPESQHVCRKDTFPFI